MSINNLKLLNVWKRGNVKLIYWMNHINSPLSAQAFENYFDHIICSLQRPNSRTQIFNSTVYFYYPINVWSIFIQILFNYRRISFECALASLSIKFIRFGWFENSYQLYCYDTSGPKLLTAYSKYSKYFR